MNLIDAAKKYVTGAEIIAEWLGSGAITVPQEQAQKRADCCIACPMNVKGGIVSDSVAKAVKRQVEIKNKLKLRVSGEQRLGKCQACLCESKLKIWLPLQRILPDAEELNNFAPGCWLRTESKP